MAKTDEPYSEITKKAISKQLRKPNWLHDKDVVALDTETIDGDIFMLSVSGPGYSFVVEDGGDILSEEKIFDTLTRNQFRGNCNVFFNLKFDASVILKILPLDNCQELRIRGKTTYEDYEIKYIPGKFLEIVDGNKHKYEYFDVAQIFGNTLENAVESWLDGESKNEEGIDTEKFSSRKYIKENYRKIKKYARRDAELTRKISLKLFKKAENEYNIPCGRPYSTGYLASQYLTQRMDNKIGYGPEKVQKMAWESYSGGRFEVFKRGKVGRIVGPDVNSAYPAKLSGLPDPSTLNWKGTKTSNIRLADIREADYGFVNATISTDKSKKIQPFAKKINGTQTYPALENVELTVIKDIFLFALDNGYITDYEIHNAVIGYVNDQTRYPFSFMKDKYTERKELEEEGNYTGANTIKIYLNSIYGKTLQTVWEVTDYDLQIDLEEVEENDNIQVDRESGIVYKERLKCGAFFNPFIGTYTTGLTRLQLHETVEDLGLVDDTILFATDCIMVEDKAYRKNKMNGRMAKPTEPYSDQLGKWDMDYTGEAFVIGSGVYQVETDSGKQKTVSRGFGSLEREDLIELAKDAGSNPIDTGNYRPIGFNEAIHGNNLTLEDVGKFTKSTKKLYPDFDTGREWEREDVTFDDLLTGKESSSPVTYMGDT